MSYILHIASRASWAAALEMGEYRSDSLTSEGFIHCSKPEQLVHTANLLFSGQEDLVLLVIDPTRLTVGLKFEMPENALPSAFLKQELFPHIYGALNLDAVVSVLDFSPGPDGQFTLPHFA